MSAMEDGQVVAGQGVEEGRAELYFALAEALAEPPAWLAGPGREWPLYAWAETLAPISPAAAQAVPALAEIEAEPATARRARYRALFAGPGRPQVCLHESLHRGGRLPGPETFAVARIYEVAGLEIADGKLPDHASLELSFLGHLARQESAEPAQARAWRGLARQFMRKHAGCWLPELGRALVAAGDPVYAPIGRLLAGWLREAARPGLWRRREKRARRLPRVRQEACTLCGFCVQVCPTRALAVQEDARETALMLVEKRCSGCGYCVQACVSAAMAVQKVAPTPTGAGERRLLCRSPRATCPGCGRPTVSRAELDFVATRLGRPRWLEYCLRCRALLPEENDELSAGIPAV